MNAQGAQDRSKNKELTDDIEVETAVFSHDPSGITFCRMQVSGGKVCLISAHAARLIFSMVIYVMMTGQEPAVWMRGMLRPVILP